MSQALMDQLLSSNRELYARNAELEQQLADESTDHYREAWAAVTQALDQANPNWRDSGPTAKAAAVASILSAAPKHTQAAFLAVRGGDAVPIMSVVAARAYENRGYSIFSLYL